MSLLSYSSSFRSPLQLLQLFVLDPLQRHLQSAARANIKLCLWKEYSWIYVGGTCSNLPLPDVRLCFPGRYWCHLGKTSTRVFSPTASSASWASKRCTVLVREQKKCSSRHWDRLSTEDINIYVQLLFIATDMFSHCLFKPPHFMKNYQAAARLL